MIVNLLSLVGEKMLSTVSHLIRFVKNESHAVSEKIDGCADTHFDHENV